MRAPGKDFSAEEGDFRRQHVPRVVGVVNAASRDFLSGGEYSAGSLPYHKGPLFCFRKRRVRAGATVMRYFRNRQVLVKDAGGNQRATTLAVGFDKTHVCATGYTPESSALSWLHRIKPIPKTVHYSSGSLFGREAVFFSTHGQEQRPNTFQCSRMFSPGLRQP